MGRRRARRYLHGNGVRDSLVVAGARGSWTFRGDVANDDDRCADRVGIGGALRRTRVGRAEHPAAGCSGLRDLVHGPRDRWLREWDVGGSRGQLVAPTDRELVAPGAA